MKEKEKKKSGLERVQLHDSEKGKSGEQNYNKYCCDEVVLSRRHNLSNERRCLVLSCP